MQLEWKFLPCAVMSQDASALRSSVRCHLSKVAVGAPGNVALLAVGGGGDGLRTVVLQGGDVLWGSPGPSAQVRPGDEPFCADLTAARLPLRVWFQPVECGRPGSAASPGGGRLRLCPRPGLGAAAPLPSPGPGVTRTNRGSSPAQGTLLRVGTARAWLHPWGTVSLSLRFLVSFHFSPSCFPRFLGSSFRPSDLGRPGSQPRTEAGSVPRARRACPLGVDACCVPAAPGLAEVLCSVPLDTGRGLAAPSPG